MFKNRALQVKVVRPDETSVQDVTVGDTIDAINETIAKNVKPVAMSVACIIAAKTASEIALHIARTYIK